ncbi:non-homologous end joining protein Ku [Gellertiella hungarica]|uniref:Non-homologous end joining protein Ku n=1 Tax=Gellertiella hungarica TaxID=1572859 RepID=A0A7W6J9B5_9HYPH|nr:Ku protein [Gellertiella hungarica]MBB4067189.1 DNA end-binding protein Ku [Gellertiella hungarica]
MTARASWKGEISIGDLSLMLTLHAAASTSERIVFHMLNRRTGNRLHREFVDSESGKAVDDADEMKGYEVADDDYLVIDPEEISGAVPRNDHRLHVEAVIDREDFDRLFLDRPYFLLPAREEDREDYVRLRDALAAKNRAIIASAVLFRRVRHLIIRAESGGLVAATLHFRQEVRSSDEVFDQIPEISVKGEMLELATHIIQTRAGAFDPEAFDDRYEAALVEVVKAKLAGRKIRKPPEPERGKVIDLMQALRESADLAGSDGRKPAGKAGGRKPAKQAPRKRKAG